MGRSWLTLRAARMLDQRPSERQDIAVSIEACDPLERADLFARVHGLTPRESDVLGRLAVGDDTKSVARGFGVSEYAVQDHLKAIFAKTGAHDRRNLLACALGT